MPVLLDTLQLDPLDPPEGDGSGGPGGGEPLTWLRGTSLPQPWGRVFGGQVLAQAVLAAGATVAPSRPVHSLHAYFLRPGDLAEPLIFGVERLRDGRSFSARRVSVHQHGRTILAMVASFQAPGPGLDHAVPMPDVPEPESLPSLEERYPAETHPDAVTWLHGRPVDLRHVESPLFTGAEGPAVAAQAVWLRCTEVLPDDPAVHAAVLAFASDYTVLEPALRRHGIGWQEPGLTVASLDHAMWWHRAARADDWILFVQESPTAGGARALGTGRMYARDGALVAVVAQEGIVRLPG